MTDKRTTMTIMPKIKSQQEVFDRSISPVLDKLVRICDKNGISMQFVAQINSSDDLSKIVTEAIYTDESNQLFEVITKLSQGDLDILELPEGDYYLRSPQSPLLSTKVLAVPFNGEIH